jgi:uncharacterized protein with ATP-grasp and redox domains
MHTYLDCIPCLLNQALRAARLSTDDEHKIKQVLDEVGSMIKSIPMDNSPPATARIVYRKIKEITGNPDPYRKHKNRSTRQALALYPVLKNKVKQSRDRLLKAVQIAIVGNIIDFGVNQPFSVEAEIEALLSKDLNHSDYDRFKAELKNVDEVLYIGDNAGETVFDRILIDGLKKPVTYVARSEPVINDATCADAVLAGLDRVATLVTSGTDAPGTVLDTCDASFRKKFSRSRFIISKGQGNFEALSNETAPLYFLLIAKCPVIARDMGVNLNDMILKRAGN